MEGARQKQVSYDVAADEVDIVIMDDPADQVGEGRGGGAPCPSSRRYTRQSTKAKHHWKTVRKHVEQKSQRRASIMNKWMDLKRSMSHEVEDFFVLNEEQDDWMARSERLRQRSFLLRAKKRDSGNQVQHSNQVPQSNQGLLSYLRSREGIGAFDDEADVVISDWLCKTPEGRLSTHSRQVSRVSSGSCKRLTRVHPAIKLEKDSVFKMAVNGIRHLSRAAGYRGSPPQRESSTTTGRHRSIKLSPVDISLLDVHEDIDEMFFDDSCHDQQQQQQQNQEQQQPSPPPPNCEADFSDYSTFGSVDTIDGDPTRHLKSPAVPPQPAAEIMRPRAQPPPLPAQQPANSRRMPNNYIMEVAPNADRRQLGIGMVGALLGVDYRESRMDDEVYKEMQKLQDYRPFFTYWVTFVQIIIYVFTIAVYDVAPLSETDVTKEVRMITLGRDVASYKETGNMWFGPNQADLIHLGAKYSPCMRLDKNVMDNLEIDRNRERSSGCCVYNDGSGCAQMVKSRCSEKFAYWKNMTVCGQDPKHCSSSILPPEHWSKDDITEWPICRERPNVTQGAPKHMTCEVIARPCCLGIHGQCIVTTSEHCDFRGGHFHPEAALCSQVKTCMSELCGMLPFDRPNQFYRLWTSLLLHAGAVQLLISVVLQFFVLRDLEKLLGWLRVGCIYIISGIGGSLASAIFLPYQAEAGPSGSQFAIIACLFVELIQNWKVIDRPWLILLKLILVVVVLLLAGLMPWVDNYAHLFGFTFGFLLSFTLMPYVKFNILTKKGRIMSVAVCLTLVATIFTALVILFYVFPIYSCPHCHYFNCIPFTRTFCKSTEVSIENHEL